MESFSSHETVQLQRTTAMLAPNQQQIKYSPDDSFTLADPNVLASAPGQVGMNNYQASQTQSQSSAPSTIGMNPILFTSICFLCGVLVTLLFTCLLDKREQEKRKMKKMEELLQPQS